MFVNDFYFYFYHLGFHDNINPKKREEISRVLSCGNLIVC